MWVATNISMDFSFGGNVHQALALPSPIPVINASIELPATMYWPPGYALNKLSMTSTVEHKSMDIVLDGHDHGPMCLHLTLPIMANPLLAVIIPMSSRKIVFTASTVEMDKKAVGLSTLFIVPMQTCGDPVSAPTAFSAINLFFDSVHVGIVWKDIWMGLLNIALSTGIDFLFSKILQGPKPSPGEILGEALDNMLSSFGQIARKELFKKIKGDFLMGNWKNSLAKKGASLLGGLLTSELKDGNPTAKIDIGNDWLGGSLEWSPEKGFGGEAHGGGLQTGAGATDSAMWGESAPPLL